MHYECYSYSFVWNSSFQFDGISGDDVCVCNVWVLDNHSDCVCVESSFSFNGTSTAKEKCLVMVVESFYHLKCFFVCHATEGLDVIYFSCGPD